MRSTMSAGTEPTTRASGFASIADGYATAFGKAGYLGVSFFFVLSGFVPAWAPRPGERVTAFLRRRLLKIFPNHVVVFAGAAVTSAADWLPNLLLIHTWFPQASVNLSVNPPSWSLGSELLYYMLFPLLIAPIRTIRGAALWVWSGLMIVGMVLVQLVSTYVVPDTPKPAITPVSDGRGASASAPP